MASAQHHYRQGELLLARVTTADGRIASGEWVMAVIAAAQAHFAAAVAAVAAEATLGRAVVLDVHGPSPSSDGVPS